ARLAVDRQERRAPVALHAREGVLEQLELGLTTDERRTQAAHRLAELDGADDAMRADRIAPAAQLDRVQGLELHAVPQECSRAGTDEDLVHRGVLLQAGGGGAALPR